MKRLMIAAAALAIAAPAGAQAAVRHYHGTIASFSLAEQLNQEELARIRGQMPIPVMAPAFQPYDGTYQLVSSTKISATYVTRQGLMGFCPERKPGPLSVAQGQVRYVSATGHRWEGMVNSQGQLMMQRVEETRGDTAFEMNVTGVIDSTGTVHARQRSNSCSYDFAWLKQ